MDQLFSRKKPIFHVNFPRPLWLSINFWGSENTYVRTVSRKIIQVGFSSESAMPPSFKNFNRRCMEVKDEGYRPVTLNP